MFFTHDIADAFGDWLERGHIQRALIAALPELADAITPDEQRPLLWIRRPAGDTLIVARAADDAAGRWIVGIPDQPAPTLHDVDSPDEVVDIVRDALARPDSRDDQGDGRDIPGP
ncbi:hypothetical protein CFK38_07645 [Brachybacterium vulturis]|uniref:Uncharacterized protein n=1 Tax=Brachybacterium vulturis TaxID=2017484 RepID=A0A291GN73_9MICO|nr:hypothetical protein CFK38_07645 [Brachybacterium vulturis]